MSLIILSNLQADQVGEDPPVRGGTERVSGFMNNFKNPVRLPPYSQIALHSVKFERLTTTEALLGIRIRGIPFQTYNGCISGISNILGFFPNFDNQVVALSTDAIVSENASGSIYHQMNPPIYVDVNNTTEMLLSTIDVDLVNIFDQRAGAIASAGFQEGVVILHVRAGRKPPKPK